MFFFLISPTFQFNRLTVSAYSEFEVFYNEKRYREWFSEFKQQETPATVVLCDEFLNQGQNPNLILDSLNADQNIILFTSTVSCVEIPQFEIIHLSASLRSTGAISRFATRWKHWSESSVEFDCHPAHNFEGERVDIQIIQKCGMEVLEYPHFTAKCVTLIKHTAEKLGDHGVFPVICFMSNALQDMLFSTFRIMFPNQPCISRTEYMNHQPRNHGTTIVSYNPTEIEGIEFGAVVIVISYMHLADFYRIFASLFFTAVTRASTNLTIIVSDLQLLDCCEMNEDPKNNVLECCLPKLRLHENFLCAGMHAGIIFDKL